MDGRPALGGGLVAVLVFFWGMQDGDADVAVGVDVRVEEGRLEAHLWWEEWVLGWEGEARAEETTWGGVSSLPVSRLYMYLGRVE